MTEWTLQSAQTHNRRLLKAVDSFLHGLGWTMDQLDGFAVTIGPGSFTGLRIGLTTVKTLAWTLKKPFVGIPTLDALAAPFGFSSVPVCAMLDAHKKEVYCAMYQADGQGKMDMVAPYQVMSPERVLSLVKGRTIFCGDGWLLAKQLLTNALGPLIVEAPAPYHLIRASFVGALARSRFLAGEVDDPMTSIPLYVRPSEAELRNACRAEQPH